MTPQPARYTRLRADLALTPPGPAPALPPPGLWFPDNAFGTTLLRVTDPRDGLLNGTSYPYWPAWNADTTRLLCHTDGQAFVYDFDPCAFTATRRRRVAHGLWHEDLHWSAAHPNHLFGREQHAPTHLWRTNVQHGSTRLQWAITPEFPGCWLAQISLSDDAARAAATLKQSTEPYAVVGYVVRDLRRHRTLLAETCEPGAVDEVRLSRAGTHLVALWSDPENPLTSRRNRLVIHHLESATTSIVLDEQRAEHHLDASAVAIYGRDNWTPALRMRPFARPDTSLVLLDYAQVQRHPWEHDGHVSARGRDPDWILVSDQSATQTPDVLGDEIYLVHTPTGGVRRVCHHRARAAPYEAHPMPVLSPCGRFAAFGSGWDGTLGEGRKDLFVARLEGGA